MAPQAKISEAVLGPAAAWVWALDAMQSALPPPAPKHRDARHDDAGALGGGLRVLDTVFFGDGQPRAWFGTAQSRRLAVPLQVRDTTGDRR